MSEAQNGGNVMERLTYRDKDGFPMMKKRGGFKQGGVERLAAYEDTRHEPEEIDMDHEAAEQLRQLCRNCDLDRLEKLAEADKAGRLVVLPCKVGDTVYILRRTFDGADVVGETELWWDDIPQLGKTVFLTREEAEKALEAMKDGNG